MPKQGLVVRGDGLVVNSIWVEDDSHPVAEGHTLILFEVGGIGWTWDGTELVEPPELPDVESPVEPDTTEIWEALKAKGIVTDADIQRVRSSE